MLDLESIKEFLIKAQTAICKIIINEENNSYGSGFFCKIPYTDNNNNLLPVLITNNHALPKNIIESEDNIKIKIDKEIKNISLKIERKKWTDEKMDFTVIEITDNDEIDDFFYLDDKIYKKNYANNNYIDKNVIVYGIQLNGKIGFSNGKIKKIDEFDYSFAYTCNTYPGCSGGCLANQNNNCVIGIHCGEIKTNNNRILNTGIFIWNIINYLKSLNKKNSSKNNKEKKEKEVKENKKEEKVEIKEEIKEYKKE